MTFNKSGQVVGRDFMGEFILVPLAGRTANLTSIFAANDVAALIWKLIDGAHDDEVIIDAVVQEFDTTREQAAADYAVFIGQLKQVGAVTEVAP